MPRVRLELSDYRHDVEWRTPAGELIARLGLRIETDGMPAFSCEVVLTMESRFSIVPEVIAFSTRLPGWAREDWIRSAVEAFYTEVVWNLVSRIRKEGRDLIGFVFPTNGCIGFARLFEYEVTDGAWALVHSAPKATGRTPPGSSAERTRTIRSSPTPP